MTSKTAFDILEERVVHQFIVRSGRTQHHCLGLRREWPRSDSYKQGFWRTRWGALGVASDSLLTATT